MATTSQPRSLLSIAKLNMARSRARPSIWSFVRIDQTCLGRSGGFAPVSLPLFHGTRLGSHSLDPAWPYSSARLQRREHVPPDEALESVRFSRQSGLRGRPSGKRPVANDPQRSSATSLHFGRPEPWEGRLAALFVSRDALTKAQMSACGDKLKFSARSVHYRLWPLHGQSRPCTRPRPKAFASHNGTVSS